jgi:hypothetical protein
MSECLLSTSGPSRKNSPKKLPPKVCALIRDSSEHRYVRWAKQTRYFRKRSIQVQQGTSTSTRMRMQRLPSRQIVLQS